jgi:hypothetical protein
MGHDQNGEQRIMIRPNQQTRRVQLERFDSTVMPYATAETDEAIGTRITERFDILGILTHSAMVGDSRALIVSGPPGLGKSFQIEKALDDWDPDSERHVIVKGFVRATGLVKTLFNHKDEGHVIVFDDADSIFYDDVSLALLKAVCDTTEKRVVSWLAETRMIDADTASIIPTTFEFKGTIIFITNLDFDDLIAKGHKLTPHLEALVSRAHYIDLAIKTRRDYLVRIRQVMSQGLLAKLTQVEQRDVMAYIEAKHEALRELSLRSAIKIGNLRKAGGNWQRVADVTVCRG